MDETNAPISHAKVCKNLNSTFQIVADAKIKPIINEYIDLICQPPE